MSNASGTLTFTKKNIEKYQTSKYKSSNPSDEEIVIQKCINWIEHRDNFPKTQDQIDKVLRQLAETKKKLYDVREIFDFFNEKGIITFEYSDDIIYNLTIG